MTHLIKGLVLCTFLLVSALSFTSCGSTTVKSSGVPNTVRSLSDRRLDCIDRFLVRDVGILNASKVCQDIFKIK